MPAFLAGVAVSVRCYWSTTDARIRFDSAEYRLRASETGLAVIRIAPPVVHLIPNPPVGRSWIARFSFSHRRRAQGRVCIDLLHVPYWPLWLITSPPIVSWLHREGTRQLRARRGRQNLCVECGYDLTGNLSGTCPECGRVRCPKSTPTSVAPA